MTSQEHSEKGDRREPVLDFCVLEWGMKVRGVVREGNVAEEVKQLLAPEEGVD
jgi:hypothetical protein